MVSEDDQAEMLSRILPGCPPAMKATITAGKEYGPGRDIMSQLDDIRTAIEKDVVLPAEDSSSTSASLSGGWRSSESLPKNDGPTSHSNTVEANMVIDDARKNDVTSVLLVKASCHLMAPRLNPR